jgi:hypothetical protein
MLLELVQLVLQYLTKKDSIFRRNVQLGKGVQVKRHCGFHAFIP